MQDDDFDPSIVLTVVEDSPPRRRRSRFLGGLLIAASVALGVGTIWAFVAKLASIANQGRVVHSSAAQRDPAEERAEAVAVFNSYDALADQTAVPASEQQERTAIEDLLERLESSAASQDLDAFRALVDADRFLRRIELTGSLEGYSALDRRYLRTEIKTDVEPEPSWINLIVAGVVAPPEDPQSRIVYVIGGNAPTDDESLHRFWIARAEDGWKLYDWERLDLGLTEAQLWAVYCKYNENAELDGFRRWSDLVREADALHGTGDVDAAKEKLELAELETAPPEVADYQRLLTGYHWIAIGETERGFACFERIQEPDNFPGHYNSLAIMRRYDEPAESLRNAELYEAAVGASPELLRLKARLLANFHRDDEAVREWKRLLLMQPTDDEALAAWLLALPETGRAEFGEFVSRLDHPAAAMTEVSSRVYFEDMGALNYLVTLAQKIAPDSDDAIYMAGLAQDMDGRNRTAAELYWQAFEKAADEESRSHHFDAYLEAMTSDGRILEALEKAPDFEESVEALLYSYDESESDISEEEYKQVVALYTARMPDSVDALQRTASLAIEEKRYDEAERLIRLALDRLPPAAEPPPDEAETGEETDAAGEKFDEDEYYRTSLTASLGQVLYKLDRWREAYEGLGDHRERFAQLWALARDDDRWDVVGELLALHRGRDPDDPEVDFVDGELAVREKLWDAAVQSFQQGAGRVSETERWRFSNRAMEVSIQAGQSLDYYMQQEDPKTRFVLLASELVSRDDWDTLTTLIAAHRERFPEDIQLLTIEADMAWAKKSYGHYVVLANQVLDSPSVDSLESYELSEIKEKKFLALLHTVNFARARELAAETMHERNEPDQLAIVAAVSGEAAIAQKWARAAAQQDGAWSIYQHTDFGSLFLGPEFRALHQEHPAGPPYGLAPTLAILLLDEAQLLDEDDVANAAQQLDAGARVVTLRPGAGGVSTLAVQLDGASVWLQTGEGRYEGEWEFEESNGALAAAAGDGKGWLAIGTAGWNEADRERVDVLARKLARKLVGNRASVIFARRRVTWPYLVALPASDAVLDTWTGSGDLQSFSDSSETLQMSADSLSVEGDRRFVQQLWDAVHAFEGVPGTRLTVGCSLGHNDVEVLKLSVTAVRRKFGLQFDGTLQDDSQLISELKAGLPLRFEENRIDGFQLNDEPPVFRP